MQQKLVYENLKYYFHNVSNLITFMVVTFMINTLGHDFIILQLESSMCHSNTSCCVSLYRRNINPNGVAPYSDEKLLNMKYSDKVLVAIEGNCQQSSVMNRCSLLCYAFIRSLLFVIYRTLVNYRSIEYFYLYSLRF